MAEGCRRILIIAGEASGDLHGSALIRSLLDIDPHLEICGIGGKKMLDAGMVPIYDISGLSIVGITEVFQRLPYVFGAYRLLRRSLHTNPPDLVILIDYPEFNLTFARNVKKKGIPIVYYISPQVWAWRSYRVRKIARLVDKMIVLFPFEVSLYEKEGVDVEFLGHPILDDRGMYISRQEARDSLGIPADSRVVGLLPGSRYHEIERLLPVMLDALQILKQSMPHLEFILPLADGIDRAFIDAILKKKGVDIRIFESLFYEVLKSSDAAIVASGTATLQTALCGTPMVIVYKVSPLTYWVGKRLIRTDMIGMVNIVAGRKVVEEFIQDDMTPENIAGGVIRLFEDGERARILNAFKEVREKMGEPGACERIARRIYEFATKAIPFN